MAKQPEKKPELKETRLSIDVSAPLKKAFKLKAAEQDHTIKEVLAWLMDGYVKGKFKMNGA